MRLTESKEKPSIHVFKYFKFVKWKCIGIWLHYKGNCNIIFNRIDDNNNQKGLAEITETCSI